MSNKNSNIFPSPLNTYIIQLTVNSGAPTTITLLAHLHRTESLSIYLFNVTSPTSRIRISLFTHPPVHNKSTRPASNAIHHAVGLHGT